MLTEEQYRAVIDGAGNYGEVINPLLAVCIAAGNTLPMHYAASTAIHQLDAWVAGGPAPPSGPRFAFANGALAKDEHGNTIGGIRLPPIDVPVARYESTTCQLGGITVPFTDVQILGLYGTHAEYYRLMAEHTDRAVASGWLLPPDAVDLMRRACEARIRFGPLTPADCPAYVAPAFNSPLPTPGPQVPDAPAPAPAAPVQSGAHPASGGGAPVALAAALAGIALALRRI
jgi:hypothetical protein